MNNTYKKGNSVITEHYYEIGSKFMFGKNVFTVRKNNPRGQVQGVCGTQDNDPRSSLHTFSTTAIRPVVD